MDYLLINSIVYILTILWLIFKLRKLTISIAVFFAFTIVAILGYVTTIMDIQLVEDVNFGKKTSPLPFFCLYVTVLYMIYPLSKIDEKKIRILDIDSKKIAIFYKMCVWLYLIVSVVKLYELKLTMDVGFAEAYIERHFYGGNLVDFGNPLLEFISRKGMTFVGIVFPVCVYYSVFRFIRYPKNVLKNVFLFFLSFFPNILNCLTTGSKGMLFFLAFDFVFFYIYFKLLIPSKVNRYLKIVGSVFAIGFLSYAIVIQTERNESSNNEKLASEVMLRYLGEAMPNLGALYDDTKVHPYGKRFFPEIIGEKTFESEDESAEYWTSVTKARILNFKTIWGDSYVEFGFLGAFLFLFLTFWIFDKFVFSHANSLYMFPLVYYYFHKVCMYGVFNVGYVDLRSLQVTIYYIVFCILLKKYFLSNGKKNNSNPSPSILSIQGK